MIYDSDVFTKGTIYFTGYDQPGFGGPGVQFPGSQFMNDPMANMAMQYGTSLAGQGTEYVHKNVGFIYYIQYSK